MAVMTSGVWITAVTAVTLPPSTRLRLVGGRSPVMSTPAVADAGVVAAPSTPMGIPPLEERVGQKEDALFKMVDSNVQDWRENANAGQVVDIDNRDTVEVSALEKVLRDIGTTITEAPNPAEAVRFWTYHLGRSSYFILQWALLYVNLDRAFMESTGPRGLQVSSLASAIPRLLLEALRTYVDDYRSIARGDYKAPYDMTSLNHRQFQLPFILDQSRRFVAEAVDTLRRDARGVPDPLWLKLDERLYPSWYRTFHYQTQGWMSTDSSKVYEASTETLFLGRQDAMQRLTMVPLGKFVDERNGSPAESRKLDLLEVGCEEALAHIRLVFFGITCPYSCVRRCGTGRFLTFVMDSFGDKITPTALDLSPFYLERAWENMRYAKGLLGWTGGDARFVQANAESMPLRDESFDVVTSVYLFHELPREARVNVIKEMARVLRPGGQVIITDSLQLGDRPAGDERIENFSNLNEPFYRDYISESLTDMFLDAGLEPEYKGLRSSTKTVSFRKPSAGHAADTRP